MFNPNSDSPISTGEPPTSSSDISRNIVSTSSDTNQQEMNSLSVLEPDSGYEASPSSIADNQSFFSEQSVNRQSDAQRSPVEQYIVPFHSQILFSDSESDELDDYETCGDCSSSISCNCYRTDSSATTTAMNCDNSRCNSRPSSQPIQIPMASCRVSDQLVTGSPVRLRPLTRSQPLDLSPLQRLNLIERHPLSWPSIAPFRNISIALTPPRSNSASRDINRNTSRRNNHQSRRQIIDSDASSYCSSDDEALEDVFHMPSGEASSYPTTITMGSSVPLPDVVLESTDSGRRSRSMSVNLPPDSDRYRDIGQRLRRMSDQFQQRHQVRVMRVRSRTTSDCEHLRRNGLS